MLRKVRYDVFYGTPLDHLLRLWGIDTLIICGTVANICVDYTAASAALRWYGVVIPRDAISALEPFDLEASLRQPCSCSPGARRRLRSAVLQAETRSGRCWSAR